MEVLTYFFNKLFFYLVKSQYLLLPENLFAPFFSRAWEDTADKTIALIILQNINNSVLTHSCVFNDQQLCLVRLVLGEHTHKYVFLNRNRLKPFISAL